MLAASGVAKCVGGMAKCAGNRAFRVWGVRRILRASANL